VAIGEARAFADTEFGNNRRVFNHENVPSVFQPRSCHGGHDGKARENWEDAVKIYRARFRPLFHSLTGQEEKTIVKLVVDGTTDKVLRSHGGEYAEVIQGTIAVNMGATKKDF